MKRCLDMCLLLLMATTACASAEPGNNTMRLEQSVCGLKEPILFWLWSSQAGNPDENRLKGLTNVVDISINSVDGRVIRGYQLAAGAGRTGLQTNRPKGYLLVIQGNAMLADQILAEFGSYADAGYDVYIYDYRGYGRSEGKRRIKAIISDYKNIISALNSQPYDQKLVYAMSLGGIVLLDALSAEQQLDRIVIDSSPSRLSTYGCPENYDPIMHLPANCRNFMFIAGQQDRVVSPEMSGEMMEVARYRGARVHIDPEFSHPFMDSSWKVHKKRMSMIEKYLLDKQ